VLQLKTFKVGDLQCNCTLVWNQSTRQGFVVDPGGEPQRIKEEVNSLKIKIKALLHTHAHFDHVGATKELQEFYDCPAFLHEDDDFLIKNLDRQTDFFGLPSVETPNMTPLTESDKFLGIKILHTPGHTPGSCCFFGDFHKGKVILAGDTLFRRSVGRTDTPGGSKDQIKESILKKIYTCPPETLVIPGHGLFTTIGEEQEHNLFVRQ
jgi:glyoxylase-like metal-dependent hydrolase (beta-lactamase superfamily II)